jgi:ABC transporter DrrB family efflux protein
MFLVLFTAVFGGAVELALPEGVTYINFLMAGIVVQTVAFNSTTTALAITNDMQKGIIDRFRSLPMSDGAVLTGHVVSDVFRSGISTLVMLFVGLFFGFRPDASLLDWLVIASLLFIFTLAFSWLSAIVGVLAKSVEGVQWLTFVIVFPLTFASTAFVPAESMVSWLRGFAENQPITHVIEAVRALLIGAPVGDHVWLSVVWSIGAMAVAIPLTTWLFKRKTR